MALKFSLNLQSVAAQWMLCLLLALAAVFAYQAKPWLAFMLLPEPMTQSQLKQVNDFEAENPEATQSAPCLFGDPRFDGRRKVIAGATCGLGRPGP